MGLYPPEGMWEYMVLDVGDGPREDVEDRLREVLLALHKGLLPMAREKGVAVSINPYHEEKTRGQPHVTIRYQPADPGIRNMVWSVWLGLDLPSTPREGYWGEPEDLCRGFALGTMMAKEAEDYALDMGWARDDPDLPGALHVFLENYTLEGYSREREVLIRALAQVTPTWKLPILITVYVWTWLKLRLDSAWRDD